MKWQCHREEGGTWRACLWFEASTAVAARAWELSDLSTQLIGERWGAGKYRLTWLGAKPGKTKRLAVGTSSVFQVDGFPARACYPNAPAEAPAPVTAARALDTTNPFEMFSAMLDVTTKENRRVLDAHTGLMAQAFAFLTSSHAQDAQRQREHYEAMLRLAARTDPALSALEKKVDALLSRQTAVTAVVDDDDDDDDEEPTKEGALEKLIDAAATLARDVGPGAIKAGLKRIGVLGEDD